MPLIKCLDVLAAELPTRLDGIEHAFSLEYTLLIDFGKMNIEFPDGAKVETNAWLYLHKDNQRKAALVCQAHNSPPTYALYTYS